MPSHSDRNSDGTTTFDAAQDPVLYLLHSASLLALPRTTTHPSHKGEVFPQQQQPLPRAAASQARAFLHNALLAATAALEASTASQAHHISPISSLGRRLRYPLDRVGRAAASGGTNADPDAKDAAARRSTLGKHPRPQTSPIASALSLLPEHWRLQNPLCPSCGTILVPGINARWARSRTSPPKSKRSSGATSQPLPGLACRLCHQYRHHNPLTSTGLAANDSAEAHSFQRSKARFPSTRRRQLMLQTAPAEMTTPAVPSGGADKPARLLSDETRAAKQAKIAQSSSSWLSSQTPLRLPSTECTQSSRLDPFARTSVIEQAQTPPHPPTSMPAASSASEGNSTLTKTDLDNRRNGSRAAVHTPTRRGPSAKQDHMAALRTLLNKEKDKRNRIAAATGGRDSRNSSIAEGTDPQVVSRGGLKDFLAGL